MTTKNKEEILKSRQRESIYYSMFVHHMEQLGVAKTSRGNFRRRDQTGNIRRTRAAGSWEAALRESSSKMLTSTPVGGHLLIPPRGLGKKSAVVHCYLKRLSHQTVSELLFCCLQNYLSPNCFNSLFLGAITDSLILSLQLLSLLSFIFLVTVVFQRVVH